MQCFCRVYFHRSISRIPDSGNNHQRHKQPCQGKSRQEASGIERHLAHIHQFGITDVESDDSRRYGRQRKQQHPFVHETGENPPARTAQRQPQRNLFTALLRTEPERADNTRRRLHHRRMVRRVRPSAHASGCHLIALLTERGKRSIFVLIPSNTPLHAFDAEMV